MALCSRLVSRKLRSDRTSTTIAQSSKPRNLMVLHKSPKICHPSGQNETTDLRYKTTADIEYKINFH